MGLESLKDVWWDVDFYSVEEVISQSKDILHSIIPSIEKQVAKAKDGDPQKILNARRLTALELAIESLENRLKRVPVHETITNF